MNRRHNHVAIVGKHTSQLDQRCDGIFQVMEYERHDDAVKGAVGRPCHRLGQVMHAEVDCICVALASEPDEFSAGIDTDDLSSSCGQLGISEVFHRRFEARETVLSRAYGRMSLVSSGVMATNADGVDQDNEFDGISGGRLSRH